MRHLMLVPMLTRAGKRRHLASMTVADPRYSLCGKLMDSMRTEQVFNRSSRTYVPDCKICAELL